MTDSLGYALAVQTVPARQASTADVQEDLKRARLSLSSRSRKQ